MHDIAPCPRLHWALPLTPGLTDALASLKQRRRGHDRGQVLTHLAVAIADGATRVTDIDILGRQPAVFGPVASVATTWRTLEALDAVAPARAAARRRAGAAGLDPGFYVIDLDGTLVTAHPRRKGPPRPINAALAAYPARQLV